MEFTKAIQFLSFNAAKMIIKKENSFFKILILILIHIGIVQGVKSTPTQLPPMLFFDTSITLVEPVTNCGVEIFTINDTSYVYIFSGMDSTLKWSGIHKRCYKVNLTSKVVTQIPDLPDSLGRIALSATRIGNKIYVVGGYHVFANGSEISSSLVHEYDPIGDTFTSKKIVLPVATDDHVQLAYRDSLLYIIGGWSNTKNVNSVQILDPRNNVWHTGTPLPDKRYMAFGATGFLKKNTINMFGGASDGRGFSAKNYLISGIIDSENSKKIKWEIKKECDSCFAYRSATIPIVGGSALVLGGSDSTYNYNGKSYGNNKVLFPTLRAYNWLSLYSFRRYSDFNNATFYLDIINNENVVIPMDVRDVGHQSWATLNGSFTKYNNLAVIAGGILQNQKVSNHLIVIRNRTVVGIEERIPELPILVFPNPTTSSITIKSEVFENVEIEIYNSIGELLLTKTLQLEQTKILIEYLPAGIYTLKIKDLEGYLKIIKQ